MALKTYDAKQVAVIIGTQAATGLADGEFCSVEYNDDHVTMIVGADGEATRSIIRNKSAKITLTFQATSSTNSYLMDQYLADRATGGGVFNVLIQDNFGKDKHVAVTAWIVKPPNAAYGKDAGTRAWVIETNELVNYIGGH